MILLIMQSRWRSVHSASSHNFRRRRRYKRIFRFDRLNNIPCYSSNSLTR
jgi:hypothetical protein